METHKFSDLMGDITPEDRADIDAIKAEMRVEQALYNLSELRKQRGLTQVELAELTGKTQASISAMESAADNKISSISAMVAAMGGRLELTAVFADDRVQLA